METNGLHEKRLRKSRNSGKKSRFLNKAKKFGKQGKLGRGFEVDSETYNYYLRVLELFQKNEFDTPEDKDIFIENTFTQTENAEINLSSNQMISRVMEMLLPFASSDILTRFTTAFTPSFRTICTDPFASHVLEKLLEVISEKWTKDKPLTKWFRSTCKYVLNNFEEFVFDNYANHITRKVCQCLSGTVALFVKKQHQFTPARNFKKEEQEVEPKPEQKVRKKDVKILTDFAKSFISWPQFLDLFANECTSGLVQCLLKTLKPVDTDLLQQGLIQTVKSIKANLDMENKVHLHTLEVCLSVADEVTFKLIFDKYYKGKLAAFGVHEKGNFTLRRIINSAPNKQIFEYIFEEIVDEFSAIYAASFTSVFVSIAEKCKTFQSKQAIFVKKLSTVLGFGDESETGESFVLFLSRFGKTFPPKGDGTTSFITDMDGTMVLQHMLEFHKPFKVVSSFLELDGNQLTTLCSDPKGSHVMDAFFKSATVGDKNKEKMLHKLKEYLIPIACNKFGSRVLDGLWSWSPIKNKAIIAGSMCERESQLNSNQFGKFISQKCGLHLFKRDPKKWETIMGAGGKRKKELEKFISDIGVENETEEEVPKPKKKKKQKKQDTEDE